MLVVHNENNKKTTIDIPERTYYELKAASLLMKKSMGELVTTTLSDRFEHIVDQFEGGVDSETMSFVEKVYDLRKQENYLSEVQKETLRKIREG